MCLREAKSKAIIERYVKRNRMEARPQRHQAPYIMADSEVGFPRIIEYFISTILNPLSPIVIIAVHYSRIVKITGQFKVNQSTSHSFSFIYFVGSKELVNSITSRIPISLWYCK